MVVFLLILIIYEQQFCLYTFFQLQNFKACKKVFNHGWNWQKIELSLRFSSPVVKIGTVIICRKFVGL